VTGGATYFTLEYPVAGHESCSAGQMDSSWSLSASDIIICMYVWHDIRVEEGLWRPCDYEKKEIELLNLPGELSAAGLIVALSALVC